MGESGAMLRKEGDHHRMSVMWHGRKCLEEVFVGLKKILLLKVHKPVLESGYYMFTLFFTCSVSRGLMNIK